MYQLFRPEVLVIKGPAIDHLSSLGVGAEVPCTFSSGITW